MSIELGSFAWSTGLESHSNHRDLPIVNTLKQGFVKQTLLRDACIPPRNRLDRAFAL
jgi:hypothetical protein